MGIHNALELIENNIRSNYQDKAIELSEKVIFIGKKAKYFNHTFYKKIISAWYMYTMPIICISIFSVCLITTYN